MDVLCQVAKSFKEQPRRIKLIDGFLAYLVLLAGLQFVFCILAGNFPFNAFLAGLASTVGQFVLLAALRIQVSDGNNGAFKAVSSRRAFVDFVAGSLALHFVVIHFVN